MGKATPRHERRAAEAAWGPRLSDRRRRIRAIASLFFLFMVLVLGEVCQTPRPRQQGFSAPPAEMGADRIRAARG